MTDALSREQRCTLLAQAGREELVTLADECLAGSPALRILVSPEVGVITMQVREPVLAERFLLGDVLTCRAEVELAGRCGWSMRLGDDRVATLAAAVLDAEAQSTRPRAGQVEQLCREVARRNEQRQAEEWQQLAPTIVDFQELT